MDAAYDMTLIEEEMIMARANLLLKMSPVSPVFHIVETVRLSLYNFNS